MATFSKHQRSQQLSSCNSTSRSSSRAKVDCRAASRRQTLGALLAAPASLVVGWPSPAAAAAAAAAADDVARFGGNCPTCLGPVDGTLGSCAGIDPCSSSYDDRPPHFVAPWQFDGSQAVAVRDLVDSLEELGATVQQQRGDYVYATWSTTGPAGSGGLVDLEFLFADNDNTVAIRAAPQQQPSSSSQATSSSRPAIASASAAANFGFVRSTLLSLLGGQPSQLLESVRTRLGWEEVPILRNRRRALFFGESPFDDFGPTPPPGLDYLKDLTELNLQAEGF